jgi:D-alanyl-lipoteichoic acid acyltransferase DltB (MBOAT superfamily)
MGFSLMENFRTPYIAQSVSEFWRRWHISLSTWFRDYLYIPLGGNRKGQGRQYANMMIVFLASGLWHGPNWTYVIWGGLNGFYQILAVLRDKLLTRLGLASPQLQTRSVSSQAGISQTATTSPLRVVGNVLFTFVLIMLTWVFFRARTVDDAFLILGRIATFSPFERIDSPLNAVEMGFSVFLIGFLLVKEQFYLIIPTDNTARFAMLFVLITFVTYLFGVFSSNQFIYFQF